MSQEVSSFANYLNMQTTPCVVCT